MLVNAEGVYQVGTSNGRHASPFWGIEGRQTLEAYAFVVCAIASQPVFTTGPLRYVIQHICDF